MSETMKGVSASFQAFVREAPGFSSAWMEMVEKVGAASALDEKTRHLAYISVLAAQRLESGIPFHVRLAKAAGASREEVTSAILVGLPAVGNAVTLVLPAALAAYDSE